jgi:hypothetical protein
MVAKAPVLRPELSPDRTKSMQFQRPGMSGGRQWRRNSW